MNIWTIHGRQFDMCKFIEKHPGGKEAINLGRGRDCTYLVESYHPHSDKVWDILKKYEVNKKQEIDEENWPPQDPFYNDIKREVRKLFSNGSKDAKATWRMWSMMILGYPLYWMLIYNIFITGNYWFAFGAGIINVLFNVRIFHEAGHFSVSHYPFINKLCYFMFTLPPFCTTTWQIQHNISHHLYTNKLALENNPNNDYSYDIDVKQIEDNLISIANCVPSYLWPYILFLILPFIFIRTMFLFAFEYGLEFLRNKNIDKIKIFPHSYYSRDIYIFLSLQLISITYLYYTFGLSRTLSLYILYYLGNGMIFIPFSQISHIPQLQKYWRPTIQNEKDSWAVEQVKHSLNYDLESFLSFFLSFGLNYQIEHHLFPSINHDHYYKIAPIVRKICKKHDVPYHYENSMTGAFYKLWQSLIKFSFLR